MVRERGLIGIGQEFDRDDVHHQASGERRISLARAEWQFKGTSASVENTETDHPILMTLGIPSTPARRPGITIARLRQAISAAQGAESRDPQAIVEHVMSKWGTFNLEKNFANAWRLSDDPLRPDGTFAGADCQTIVRYAENIIRMLGAPGTAELIVVWARVPTPGKAEENASYTPNVTHPKQMYNVHRKPNPKRAKWCAVLVDGDGGLNRYEACLRFTHNGKTIYHAGGVGKFDSADEVLRVFATMSWRAFDSTVVEETIYDYARGR